MGCRASTAVASRTSFAQVVPDDLPPSNPSRRRVDERPDEAGTASVSSQRRKKIEHELKYAIEQASGQQESAGAAPSHSPSLPVSAEAEEQVIGDSRPEEQQQAWRPSRAERSQGLQPFGGACNSTSSVPRQPEEAHEQRGSQLGGKVDTQFGMQESHGDNLASGEKMFCKVETMKSSNCAEKSELDNSLAGGARLVDEPKNLVTYQSYDYDPTAEDFAAGHPIASCAPSHRRHLRRLRKYLKSLVNFPELFNDKVTARRQKMEERRKRQDQVAVPENVPIYEFAAEDAPKIQDSKAEARPKNLEALLDESAPQIA
eukprot:TRINITY_DN109622_c0_g1_i1.p1 TRINITY_DN109622_c0_g1~~TRINITY_DN109622_c0_g1_i1.p1  ORF type:complete len:330 (+),score=68.02 TRINITY_DN109622_c0_g1_i1:44-991(+)